MKIKYIQKTVWSSILIISLFTIFTISSCSKSAYKNVSVEQTDDNSEEVVIEEKEFSETDEDLLTVDYKEFYEQLSQHGEWIQVRSGEIGLNPNTAKLESESSDDNIFSLKDIFGVKDANALADAGESMVFVWKPSVELGISASPGVTPEFIPYTNGQWLNTDAGWYFKAPTPVEETVSHYGRWVNSPSAGWLWVPGRVWAPAWVDWKQNENYISWAPLPPSAYLVNNVLSDQIISDNDYVIVERKNFLEPAIYKYQTLTYNDGNRILVRDMTATDGIVVINNTVTNIGPDVIAVQNAYGRNIEYVKLHHVRQYNEVRFSNGECFVYSPHFRKFKNKGDNKVKVNVPKSYKEYDDWILNNSGRNQSNNNRKNTGNDNNSNMNSGNNSNNNKGNNDNMHNGNIDAKKKSENNNGNNNKDKDKDKDNKNKGNNTEKNNGRNNGKGK